MKTKQEWLTRRAFTAAYAKRWKLASEPTHETCSRWARSWEKKKLARWVVNASVGAGGYWEFSSKALEIAPTPSGRKTSVKRDRKGKIKSYGNFQDELDALTPEEVAEIQADEFQRDHPKK